MKTNETIELIIVALASDIPVDVRLRHVLKSLLRRYQFRCKSIKSVELEKKGAAKATAKRTNKKERRSTIGRNERATTLAGVSSAVVHPCDSAVSLADSSSEASLANP